MSQTEAKQRQEGAPAPALWHEAAPRHFDLCVPCWLKVLVVIAAAIIAMMWVDTPVAAWVLKTSPLPDLASAKARHGDIARELMLLEQWGQWTCSVLVIAAVALLDRAGRRKALALGLGCLITVLLTYLLKDLCGRSRPYVLGRGAWMWGGPEMGFTAGAAWTSFPSAHTTGAFALACGLAWFYPRGRALFMMLATITAIQRVLHGAHFVSDVIAGMGLAVMTMRWTLRYKLAGRVIAAMPAGVRSWWMGNGDDAAADPVGR